jgi:phosphoribosyl 1,2-cyclic phosphodiesterase
VRVTFWGTRGSVPVPGGATARYGGNTPCVTVEQGRGLLVLDAGTGIRRLGEALRARSREAPIDLVLSHVHWDHIQGLPFFGPVHDPAMRVRVFGPAPEVMTLRETLLGQMSPPVSVPAYAEAAERMEVTEITADQFETGNFSIRTVPLRHHGRTLGFAVSPLGGGPTVNYLTDNELGEWTGAPEWQAGLVTFLRGGEVLIHDATWNNAEAAGRSGWGHSSASQAVDLAVASGVRRLILFHHAPEHGDDDVDQLLAEARRRVTATGVKLLVDAAAEGSSLDL